MSKKRSLPGFCIGLSAAALLTLGLAGQAQSNPLADGLRSVVDTTTSYESVLEDFDSILVLLRNYRFKNTLNRIRNAQDARNDVESPGEIWLRNDTSDSRLDSLSDRSSPRELPRW